ncbi:hypothetical protein CQA44_09445 [Helicobacter sp. MIT 14-3879]|nr:hypothetical protein CQA44_09445 [Helicobacter sp. MIT 14-3879]
MFVQAECKGVSQVANEVGYVNVSAFCKNFKHSFGENPKTTLMRHKESKKRKGKDKSHTN